MQSHESIQQAINRKTKEHAKRLGLTWKTVSKWQEPTENYSDSGALNPLDRIERIVETALILGEKIEDAFAPLHYLDQRFRRICLDVVKTNHRPADRSKELLRVIKNFGKLAEAASAALEDNRLTKKEAHAIINDWQRLIRQGAIFIESIKAAVK
jgi:hypothetical protein